VQGERRATEYGYSLWSVEAYAVAGQDKDQDKDQDKGQDKDQDKGQE
jgi:hyaluronoglucosaminidase